MEDKLNENKSGGGMKRFPLAFVGSLALIAVGNVAGIFFRFVFSLFFARLFSELSANAPSAARTAENISYLLCFAVCLAVIAVTVFRNGFLRNLYLSGADFEDYGFGSDARDLLVHELPAQLLASAVFALPIHAVMLIFGEINYLPTLFMPFFCLYKAVGNVWLSYPLSVAACTLVIFVSTLFAHRYFQKNRLHK